MSEPVRLDRRLLIALPPPPSVNNLYRTVGRRRARTPAYDAWWEEAGRLSTWQRLSEDPANRIAWEALLQVWLPPPQAERKDLDNMLKAAIDLACAMCGLRDQAAFLRRVAVEGYTLDDARARAFATLTIRLLEGGQ